MLLHLPETTQQYFGSNEFATPILGSNIRTTIFITGKLESLQTIYYSNQCFKRKVLKMYSMCLPSDSASLITTQLIQQPSNLTSHQPRIVLVYEMPASLRDNQDRPNLRFRESRQTFMVLSPKRFSVSLRHILRNSKKLSC